MFAKTKYFHFKIRSKIVLILGEVSRMALADDNIRINHIIWYSRTSQLINILWNIMYSKDNGWPFENYERWCDYSSTLLRVCCMCVFHGKQIFKSISAIFSTFRNKHLINTQMLINYQKLWKCRWILSHIEIFKYVLSKEISNHELDKKFSLILFLLFEESTWPNSI